MPRNRSEDRFNPLPAMHEISPYSGTHAPCSSYSSYHDSNHVQTSDLMLNSLQNHVLLQKFVSLEEDQGKENDLITGGIPKSNSINSGSSGSDSYLKGTNSYETQRQPLLENQKSNIRPRANTYTSPGLTSPLFTSTPQAPGPPPPTEVENKQNPTPPLNTERLN